MLDSVKIRLNKNYGNSLILGCASALLGFVPSLEAQTPLKVSFSRRSEGRAQDLVLVRYVPTQKGVMLGSQGSLILTPKALDTLGIKQGVTPQANDFEFFRVYQSTGLDSMSQEERGQLQSWVNNPGGGARLRLESMSVVRKNTTSELVDIQLRPTYLMLAQMPLPQVQIDSQKANSQATQKQQRQTALGLLETSWQRLVENKYDQSLVGFESLLRSYRNSLGRDEQDKAVFGRALSRFHQVGCGSAREDFETLQKVGPFYADALYYGALCSLDGGDYPIAQKRLETLLSLNNRSYEDQTRFYLGVVHEQAGDLGRAESAYLDTVDFASNADIVKLAQERLDLLKDKKAYETYSKKIFSLMSSVGVGYDSNALSLPNGMQPADMSLVTGGSPSYLALLSLEAKNPWVYPAKQSFQYSFLMLGYTDQVIAQSTDLQSHEVGASLEWGQEIGGRHKVTASWGLNLLGKIASSEKYLTTYTLRYDLMTASLGSSGNSLESLWMHSVAVQKQQLAAQASDPKFDGNAWDINGSHRKKYFSGMNAYGLGVMWEYKAAQGSEARFAMLGPLLSYERDFLLGKLKFKFIEEIALRPSIYHASENSRKDYYVSSTSALAYAMATNYELRAQFVWGKNFSNNSARYGYTRHQSNLSFSAFF